MGAVAVDGDAGSGAFVAALVVIAAVAGGAIDIGIGFGGGAGDGISGALPLGPEGLAAGVLTALRGLALHLDGGAAAEAALVIGAGGNAAFKTVHSSSFLSHFAFSWARESDRISMGGWIEKIPAAIDNHPAFGYP